MARLTTSYDCGTVDAPLVGDTIGAAAGGGRRGATRPARARLAPPGHPLDLRGARQEVERVALGLLALGIEPGDRVGIWSPNCAEWTVLQFASARVGAILVNVNPAYRPQRARVRARPLRRAAARHRRVVQDVRLPRDDRARCATSSRRSSGS